MWNVMLLLYPELWDKYRTCPTYEQMLELGFPIKGDIKTEYFMDWLLLVSRPSVRCEYDVDKTYAERDDDWKTHSDELENVKSSFLSCLGERLECLTFEMIFGGDC